MKAAEERHNAAEADETTSGRPVVVNLYDINKCNSVSLTTTQWAIWYVTRLIQ